MIVGVFVASVTPMSSGGESIDIGCIGPLLAYYESKGLQGIVPLGTTGEFASLTFQEKIDVISECASTKGRLKMIPGCGSSSLLEVIDLMRLAARKGADAVLIPPPFYFKTATSTGIEEFFKRVLENAELPVLLYHIPSLTGIPIDVGMLERLAKYEMLWGIKDTGGSMQETSAYLNSKPGHVLLGSDTNMHSGLKVGVQGIISACANIVPELHVAIASRFKAGKDVDVLQDRLTDIRNALTRVPLHAALKRWLKFRGIDAGFVRPPLENLSADEDNEVRKLSLLYDHPESGQE